MEIKDKIRKIKNEITKLDERKSFLNKSIQILYDSCTHDFEKIYSGYEEDIFICKKCGFETWTRRNM